MQRYQPMFTCIRRKERKRQLLRKPQAGPHQEILRAFGRSLVRLQEAEAERLSIAVAMDDGDSNDHD
jgi:hypothetical protein